MVEQPPVFSHSYTRLPGEFYSQQRPSPVPDAKPIIANTDLAESLGIDCDWLQSEAALNVFSGNHVLAGSTPIATAYAGHQFGHFNPQLGDGRAILLGELTTPTNHIVDLQLKGAGTTPYSRGGDGKSPLGPVIREYIMSEAMAALGVPTTRSLYAVTTGEAVYREQIEPGGILTRIASSHIRVGTFQFFAARQMQSHIQQLADFVIDRHYPEALDADKPYQQLFVEICERQAKLVAQWQSLGFVHGVMNTDNMLVCGETVDYGPCAFIDTYKPNAVFSSIDHGGRYALDQQAAIAQWNLVRLAECLIALFDDNESEAISFAEEVLMRFKQRYQWHYRHFMAEKLALENTAESQALSHEFLKLLAEHAMDYHLAFSQLSVDEPERLIEYPKAFTPWFDRWYALRQAPHLAALPQKNPLFVPRLHLIEAAIQQAYNENSFTKFHELLDVCCSPFDDKPVQNTLKLPPESNSRVYQTFCGT